MFVELSQSTRMVSIAYAFVLTIRPFEFLIFGDQYTNLNFGTFVQSNSCFSVLVTLVVA